MDRKTLSGLRKWIVLLSLFSVLFSVQSSYACMMMADMETKQDECCCGSLHRMPEGQASTHDGANTSDDDNDPLCGEMLSNCCRVEVSLDLDDSADNEPITSNSTSLKHQLSIVKIFDDPSLHWGLSLQSDILVHGKFYYIDVPPDPALRIGNAPLYLTTERFRI